MIISLVEDTLKDKGVVYGVNISNTDKHNPHTTEDLTLDCASYSEAKSLHADLIDLFNSYGFSFHEGNTIKKQEGWTILS